MEVDNSSDSKVDTEQDQAANDVDVHENADPGHSIEVLQRQQNNEWCDIVNFGKYANENLASITGIKAPKMILAAASPYFHEAFKSKDFIDSDSSQFRVDQIDHATLEIIVNFIYSSVLRITGEDFEAQLKSVLVGADYLLIPKLVQLCGESLNDLRYLEIDCAVEMWLFARKYHCMVLETAAVGTNASGLKTIAEKNDFLGLKKADVLALLQALKQTAAESMVHADLVCDAAIAWLSFTNVDRKADCDEIMRQVSLKSMSVEALQRVSGTSLLSELVLWVVTQVYEVRAEVGEKSNTGDVAVDSGDETSGDESSWGESSSRENAPRLTARRSTGGMAPRKQQMRIDAQKLSV